MQIDPKLARFVLLFYAQELGVAADIAWALGVSPSTASRWLIGAEREGLVDKQCTALSTDAASPRLTSEASRASRRVERALATMPSDEARGVAYGLRATSS